MGAVLSQTCQVSNELHKLEQAWGLNAHIRAMAAPDWKHIGPTYCEGRICLVTAADSPLGTAVSAALARAGAVVHLVCASEEAGRELRARLAMEPVCNKHGLHVHHADPAAVRDWHTHAALPPPMCADRLWLDGGRASPGWWRWSES